MLVIFWTHNNYHGYSIPVLFREFPGMPDQSQNNFDRFFKLKREPVPVYPCLLRSKIINGR